MDVLLSGLIGMGRECGGGQAAHDAEDIGSATAALGAAAAACIDVAGTAGTATQSLRDLGVTDGVAEAKIDALSPTSRLGLRETLADCPHWGYGLQCLG